MSGLLCGHQACKIWHATENRHRLDVPPTLRTVETKYKEFPMYCRRRSTVCFDRQGPLPGRGLDDRFPSGLSDACRPNRVGYVRSLPHDKHLTALNDSSHSLRGLYPYAGTTGAAARVRTTDAGRHVGELWLIGGKNRRSGRGRA